MPEKRCSFSLGALGLRAGAPDGQFGGAQGTLGEAGGFTGRSPGARGLGDGHTTLLARNPRIIHSPWVSPD
jgi:hypothetical protein